MRKFAYLLIFFIFLAGVAWGQHDYTWNGGGGDLNWETPGNWTSSPAGGTYPGANHGDTALFNNWAWNTIIINSDFTLSRLQINMNLTLQSNTSNTINITDFVKETTNTGNFSLTNLNFNVTNSNFNGAIIIDNSITGGTFNTKNITIGSFQVQISNSSFFLVNGATINIGNSATAAVNITATGQVLSVGGIAAPGRQVNLTAPAGNNMFVTGNISASRLVMSGPGTNRTGTIVINNGVTINTTDDVITTGCANTTASSIIIRANHLIATGTGNITQAGDLCFDIATYNANQARFINIAQLHFHGGTPNIDTNIPEPEDPFNPDPSVETNKHLVYGPSMPNDLSFLPNHIHINSNTDGRSTLAPSANYNVYIVDISSHGSLNITTTGNGFIEFRENYTSNAALTLNSVQGVKLHDANITLGAGNNFNYSTNTITLEGTTNSITAPAITMGAVTGNNSDLTLNGTTAQFGQLNGIDVLTIGAGLTATASGNITAASINNSGTLDISTHNLTTGTINNSGTIRLTGITGQTVSPITATSGTVEFYGNESGFAGLNTFYNLRIIAGARTTTALTVNGAATIGTNVTTTGDQDYKTTLTLTGAVTLTGASISTGAITGGSNNLTLISDDTTIASGTGINTLTINGTAETNGNLSVTTLTVANAASTLTLGAHNLTASSITNNGTIRLTGATGQTVSPITATSGTVEFYNNESGFAGLNAFYNLIISAGVRTAAAGKTVNGTLTINTGASLAMGSNTLTIGTLTNSGTLNTGTNITVSGSSWTNNGIFSATAGTVTFSNSATVSGINTFYNVTFEGANTTISGNNNFHDVTITGAQTTFNGNNIFHDVTVEQDCIVQFPNGSEQTVLNFLNLRQRSTIKAVTSVPGSYWKLFNGKIVPFSTANTDDLSNIEDCDADSHHNFIAYPESGAHAKSNGNNHNIFLNPGDVVYTWTGVNVNNSWNIANNWTPGIPLDNDASIIKIPKVSSNRYPVLVAPVECGSLEIEDEDAEIDLKGFTLTIEDGLINKGTIKLYGTAANQVTAGEPFSTTTGTIYYYNDTISSPHNANWVFGTTYHNLVVDSTVAMVPASSLTVNGTAAIGSNITTTATAGQNYVGTLTLTDNVILDVTTPAYPINIGAVTGGGYNFELNGNATANGNITGVNELTINNILDIGGHNISANVIHNNGTLRLAGVTGQAVTPANIGGAGTVHFNAYGTRFAGITELNNIIISAGDREITTSMSVHGNWSVNLPGSFEATAGTVTFNGANTTVSGANTFNTVAVAGTQITFTGNNTITTLNSGAGMTVQFANGSSQIITNLNADGSTIRAVTIGGARWNLDGKINPANLPTIYDCHSVDELDLRPGVDAVDGFSGGNSTNINVFFSGRYTWTGTSSTVWNLPGNWRSNLLPAITDANAKILIPNEVNNIPVTNYPVLNSAVTCLDLEIEDEATINLAGNELIIIDALVNHGTIMLHGNVIDQVKVNNSPPVNVGGTIHYYGTIAGGNRWVFGHSYTNLYVAVAPTAMEDITGSLAVSGEAEIGSSITTSTYQNYGSLELLAAVTLTGTQVTMGAISGNFALTFGGTTNAIFNGNSNIGALNVNGTSAINANITTTAVAGQIYQGAVTLGGSVTPIALTGTTVTFNDAISGSGRNLEINGNAVLNGVNNIGVLTVSGNTIINADITTTGNQSYIAVNLGTSDKILTSSGGSITATGVISGTGNLTVSASSGINLNEINTLSGSVVLYNSTSGAVDYRNSGSIDLNGINAPHSTVTITSGNNLHININQLVTANRLLLFAGSNANTTGIVTIGANINANGAVTDHDDHNDGYTVHITAGTLTGTSLIILGAATGEVCATINNAINYNSSNITDKRIHFHITRNILYAPSALSPIPVDINNYVHLKSDDGSLDAQDINFYTSGTGNIYIVGIDDVLNDGDPDNDVQNTRNVIFGTDAGDIHIRGNYYSTGTLTLNPGAGRSIILGNDAHIQLIGAGNSFSTNNRNLGLNNTSISKIDCDGNISLNSISSTGSQHLELTANNININGIAEINGNLTINNSGTFTLATGSAINLTGGSFNQAGTGGNSNLAGDITTTGNGAITFHNIVTINGEVKLETVNGDIVFNQEIIGAYSGSEPIGELTLNASGAGKIEIEHRIGYEPVQGKPAYLKKFQVESTGLDLFADVYAVNMIFDKTFYTHTVYYITLAVPDKAIIAGSDAAGSIEIKELQGGRVALSGGTYDPTRHGLDALEFTQNPGSEFEFLRIVQSSYIKVKNQLLFDSSVQGKELILSAGIPPTVDRPYTATTLDLTEMNLLYWDNDLILEGRSKEESSRIIFKENMGDFLSNFKYETRDADDHSSKGWAYVQSIEGNVDIDPLLDDVKNNIAEPKLVLEMHIDLNNPLAGTREISSTVKLGSLHIYCDTVLKSDLEFNGELKISEKGNAQGKLDAGDYDIIMRAGLDNTRNLGNFSNGTNNPIKYARWEIETEDPLDGNNLPATMEYFPFKQNPGAKVTFMRYNPSDTDVFFEIVGNTMWQDFICEEGGATIQFSMHPDHHIFLGEFFVQGSGVNQNQLITLTRYIDPFETATNNWRYKYLNPTVPPAVPALSGTLDAGLPKFPASTNLKSDPQESRKFWNFNLIGTDKFNHNDIKNIQVYFSHAWYQRIPLVEVPGINLLPYYDNGNTPAARRGYFNCDWGIQFHTVIYSFAEDRNGNGKVDRIRVQSNVALNNEFGGFEVEVKIDGTTQKYSGSTPDIFKNVGEITGDPDDNNSFYINLAEHPSIYDGKPIEWWITENDTLRDLVTNSKSIGDKESKYKTINTIPPRISYALTLPGHNETFFRFSQPVVSGVDSAVGGNAVAGTNSAVESSEPYDEVLEYFGSTKESYPIRIQGDLGYRFGINPSNIDPSHNEPSYDVTELAALKPVGDTTETIFFTAEGFKGVSARALDWRDPKIDETSEIYNYYPSPRYPRDWNYSGYRTFAGNSHVSSSLSQDYNPGLNPDADIFIPPYKALSPGMIKRLERYAKDIEQTGSSLERIVAPQDFDGEYPEYEEELKRRSTDVLVSIVGASGTDNRYFVLPEFARHVDQPNSDRRTEDNTIVRDFDGSKYFEARGDIDLQARMNTSFSGTLDLFWTNNIGIEFRNRNEAPTRGKNTGGLWQPDLANWLGEDDPHYSVSPMLASSEQVTMLPKNAEGSTNLFNYTFVNNGKFKSWQKLEFIFRINNGLIEKEGVLKGEEINPDMFIACLDIPKGAEIPGDWYKRVRPFSFDIQDPRLQRGGVTIMNNVINSDKKEQTYLRYHLVRPGRVTIQVYTLDGSLVRTIRRNEQRTEGEWVDTWDGSNNGGRAVARGMYFIRIVGPDIDEIRKVMVVK